MDANKWAEVRQILIARARKTRAELVGMDDFDGLRHEIQYNYLLDEAKKYFENRGAE
jgi:hypothetical protein